MFSQTSVVCELALTGKDTNEFAIQPRPALSQILQFKSVKAFVGLKSFHSFAACIAPLLNFHIEEVAKVANHGRMVLVWLLNQSLKQFKCDVEGNCSILIPNFFFEVVSVIFHPIKSKPRCKYFGNWQHSPLLFTSRLAPDCVLSLSFVGLFNHKFKSY